MNARELALRLRSQGYSYGHISVKTGLSKSTLSYHLSKVPYTPNALTLKKIGKARSSAGVKKAQMKLDSLNHARTQAKKDIGTLSKRDVFMLGLGIYIGEGSKTHDIVRLVNSDFRVINQFIYWIKAIGLGPEHIAIRLHLYPDSDVKKAEDFWSKKLSIPKKQFQKPCVDMRQGKSRKKTSIHEFGTAHVTVRSNGKKEYGVALSRRIGAWMQEVLE
jgi:DNA-binding transcriptional ArsR family regulator